MYKIKNLFLQVMLLAFVFIACSNTPESKLPETESEALNKFVRSASVQLINLDSVQTIEIVLDESDIILDVLNDETEPMLNSINDFLRVGDQYLVYDRLQNSMYKIDENGMKLGNVARSGRGPGEHERLESIRKNSSYIYASDINNTRVNKYDHNFEYSETITEFLAHSLELNDEIMVFANQEIYGMFSPDIDGEGLIEITLVDKPDERLTTIMPKIIPSGYQPHVFNRVNVAVNNFNLIAASYYPLPWIFLFDENYELERTLIFEDSRFDTLDTVPLKIHRPNPDNKDGIGGAVLFPKFFLLDNGDLLILNHKVEHLERQENGDYKPVARYDVQYPKTEQLFWVDKLIPVNDNKMVASNWHYLFEFELLNK